MRGHVVQDVVNVFRFLDVDRDGMVDITQFRQLLCALQVRFRSEEEESQLFSLFDADDSGTITEKEFVQALFPKAVIRRSSRNSPSARQSLGGSFQTNGTGSHA